MLGRVPPLLHVHHGGILHAVGEHLPPQSEWRPPAASPSHPGRAPAPSPASRVPRVTATLAQRAAARAPGTHRYGPGVGTVPGGKRARCAWGGSPWACRAPLPPAAPPPLPPLPLSGSSARSLRRPVGPAGTGGAEEGRGCVPPARGRGGGPGACCQRAGEGPAAPLRRALAPGARRWRRLWAQEAEAEPGRQGREGRGGERGEARGEGLQARGRGSGRRGGGCSPAREARAGRRAPTEPRAQPAAWRDTGLLRRAQKLRVASEGGGAGGSVPTLAFGLGADLCLFVPIFASPSHSFPPDLFNEK